MGLKRKYAVVNIRTGRISNTTLSKARAKKMVSIKNKKGRKYDVFSNITWVKKKKKKK